MNANEIYEAVMARVRNEVPNCQSEFGAELVSAEGSPPRIVWVPSTDDFDGDPKRSRVQLAIYQVGEGYDVHLHGEDYATTRQLRDAFLRALHVEAMGCCEPERGEWAPTNAGLVRDGRLYVLSIRVQVPVTRDPIQTVTPAGVTETQTVNQ